MFCPNCNNFTSITLAEINEFQNKYECLDCGCVWKYEKQNPIKIIKEGKQVLFG